MFKRSRWLVTGMGVGAGASVWAQRRLKRWVRSHTPPAVASRTAERTSQLARQAGSEVRAALAEGREAMRQREAELRVEVGRRTRRS